MRETINQRGWDRFWSRIRLFVPRVGPPVPGMSAQKLPEPPALPPVKTAGFDTQIQMDGAKVMLRRLDAPSAISVAYRGKTYAATIEAIACLLAFFGGLRLIGRAGPVRLTYFVFVGFGALIVAGAVNPRAAGLWQAIYAGVFLSAVVWFACGWWKWLRAQPERISRLFARKPVPVRVPRPTAPPTIPPAPPAGGTPAAS